MVDVENYTTKNLNNFLTKQLFVHTIQ